MSDGINWGILNQAQNPFQSFLQGMESGGRSRAIAENQAFNREKMEAWRADREAQKQKLEAEQAKMQQYNQTLAEFVENPTDESLRALQASTPEGVKSMMDSYTNRMQKGERDQRNSMALGIMSLLDNGNKDLALERVQAAKAKYPDLNDALTATETLINQDALEGASLAVRSSLASGDPETYLKWQQGEQARKKLEKQMPKKKR